MTDFRSIDHEFATAANVDNNAKMWDGDKMKQATWLENLAEDIQANPTLRNIVYRGTVELRTGKIAVDSKSAIIAIQDGTAKKARAHASCATRPPKEWPTSTGRRPSEAQKWLTSSAWRSNVPAIFASATGGMSLPPWPRMLRA